jgi:hypothetical protein
VCSWVICCCNASYCTVLICIVLYCIAIPLSRVASSHIASPNRAPSSSHSLHSIFCDLTKTRSSLHCIIISHYITLHYFSCITSHRIIPSLSPSHLPIHHSPTSSFAATCSNALFVASLDNTTSQHIVSLDHSHSLPLTQSVPLPPPQPDFIIFCDLHALFVAFHPCITSHHITSHHITSHHITSHHITSHHSTTLSQSPSLHRSRLHHFLRSPKLCSLLQCILVQHCITSHNFSCIISHRIIPSLSFTLTFPSITARIHHFLRSPRALCCISSLYIIISHRSTSLVLYCIISHRIIPSLSFTLIHSPCIAARLHHFLRPAQNALRQDHAAHFAKSGARRRGQHRRRFDARRSDRSRLADCQIQGCDRQEMKGLEVVAVAAMELR